MELFLEDLAAGQTYEGKESFRINEEKIKTFAAEFDPQPFHLDHDAAGKTLFEGLAASGWHTAAITMWLLVRSDFKPAGGVIGASIEDLRWPSPVRPGDELRVQAEILEIRPSKSRPEIGFIKVKVNTLNQAGVILQSYTGNLVVQRRLDE